MKVPYSDVRYSDPHCKTLFLIFFFSTESEWFSRQIFAAAQGGDVAQKFFSSEIEKTFSLENVSRNGRHPAG